METHVVIKYQIEKFWDDSFKQLSYANEEFNDQESLDKWLALGYANKFTGDLCDMRKPQPSWNYLFVELFADMGWKDIGTSYYRMMPGTILPIHSDLYKHYIEIFNLNTPEQQQSIRRAVIFLEDWQPGHYAELLNQPFTNWVAGSTVEWNYDAPHLAANLGPTPRYTLQITGHVDK
jgi:hypothetical protein